MRICWIFPRSCGGRRIDTELGQQIPVPATLDIDFSVAGQRVSYLQHTAIKSDLSGFCWN